VSFAAITLCVAFQRVFIVVGLYFVIDSVRKLLDTPSYNNLKVTPSTCALQKEYCIFIIAGYIIFYKQQINGDLTHTVQPT